MVLGLVLRLVDPLIDVVAKLETMRHARLYEERTLEHMDETDLGPQLGCQISRVGQRVLGARRKISRER